ncbi:MAG: LuxR C-terminal-related transcriptional regulator [Boseongicola sp.]
MRLLIYSKTRLFSECLVSGLEAHSSVERCVGFWKTDDALDALSSRDYSAAIVDLGADDGWSTCEAFQALDADTLILGLAVDDRPDDLVRCARAGCAGVIPFRSSCEETVEILRRALRGEFKCSPEGAAKLMKAVSRPQPVLAPDCLTKREGEVCGLVCEGMTNKQIARRLSCSEGTVKNHVHNILSKLELPRRSALSLVVASRAQSTASGAISNRLIG